MYGVKQMYGVGMGFLIVKYYYYTAITKNIIIFVNIECYTLQWTLKDFVKKKKKRKKKQI